MSIANMSAFQSIICINYAIKTYIITIRHKTVSIHINYIFIIPIIRSNIQPTIHIHQNAICLRSENPELATVALIRSLTSEKAGEISLLWFTDAFKTNEGVDTVGIKSRYKVSLSLCSNMLRLFKPKYLPLPSVQKKISEDPTKNRDLMQIRGQPSSIVHIVLGSWRLMVSE